MILLNTLLPPDVKSWWPISAPGAIECKDMWVGVDVARGRLHVGNPHLYHYIQDRLKKNQLRNKGKYSETFQVRIVPISSPTCDITESR